MQKTLSEKPEKFNFRSQLLGDIVTLMLQAPLQRRYYIFHLATRIISSLKHKQYKIYYDGSKPVAFIAWSMLSEEVEKKYIAGDYDLLPEEWQSGDRMWIMEMICLKKYSTEVIQDVGLNIIGKKTAKSIKRDKNGYKIRVRDWVINPEIFNPEILAEIDGLVDG